LVVEVQSDAACPLTHRRPRYTTWLSPCLKPTFPPDGNAGCMPSLLDFCATEILLVSFDGFMISANLCSFVLWMHTTNSSPT
jgi:hypothetical protein